MCVPADAQPPVIPGPADRPTGRRTELVSGDGCSFAAYEVAADEPTGAAIVVLPDVRGLFSFYESLAEGFAAAGVDAIAIDYFGRTAQSDARPGDWDFWPHVLATKPELVRSDVAAAVTRLRGTRAAERVYTVGFCFGGGQSFAQAASGLDLSGVVGFYGPPRRKRDNFASPLELVDRFECPVLGLFGGADESIPPDQIEDFERALNDAGVSHELHTYPGAPHSFFDRSYDDYSTECADAWERVLAFVGRS
jgi:carboxymethylenebutenolidase